MKKLVAIASLLLASNAFAINVDVSKEPFATYFYNFKNKDFRPDLTVRLNQEIAQAKSPYELALAKKRFNIGVYQVVTSYTQFKPAYEVIYDGMKQRGMIADESKDSLDKVYNELVRAEYNKLNEDMDNVNIGGDFYEKLKTIIIKKMSEREKEINKIKRNFLEKALKAVDKKQMSESSKESDRKVITCLFSVENMMKPIRTSIKNDISSGYDIIYENARNDFQLGRIKAEKSGTFRPGEMYSYFANYFDKQDQKHIDELEKKYCN